MLTSIDDPDHARLRRLVTVAFTPKAVEQYRVVAKRALDEAFAALDPSTPIDLVTTLATEVPTQVIGELLGCP